MNPKDNKARPDRARHKAALLKAYDDAARIAFSPFIFQAAVAAKKLGMMARLGAAAEPVRYEVLAEEAGVSPYGARLLMQILSAAGVVEGSDEAGYLLTKTGECLTYDAMTAANFDFTADVNYKGLAETTEAIRTGKPAGLKAFDPAWETIYPHLKDLPAEAQKSWFAFDHFYSDGAFREALRVLAARAPARFFDIGGNTGRFTKMALEAWPETEATIVDLPEQIGLMRANPDLEGLQHRIRAFPIDWLSEGASLDGAGEADLIWMSQFLDCFSRAEAVGILNEAKKALAENGVIVVMEPLCDRQRNDTAALSLAASSLYFTVLANGNSRFFFEADLLEIFEAAGLEVIESHPNLGVCHTLFVLRPKV
ncbi:MAG: class I SAM-dependent methyltransferase [Sutterella parvirubra]|uniref:Methyltransferase domain protein n=1 Tax=Sutterella parvirubra YIT 11816 TaxID=762967 RepID=H3KE79_9BURK|nr:methyltransferase [Sutterella parvirubra]EHY31578.1 methyltransferase domain protein [Sutterella parvirubra YIT 11816]MCI7709012.1 class I SAM-dependent methyltransferase [Sutterella parvirubra]MDY5202321.1 methyltransferase [Sutterella parvirubra]